MFSEASQLVVDNFGKNTLIPVLSLDEGNKVKLLQLVVMERNKFIFWPRLYYKPTEFQLSKILQSPEPFNVTETNQELSPHFQRSKTFSSKAKADIINVAVEATDTVTMQVNLGKVVKTEVNQQELIEQLMNRNLNLEHPFIRQVRQDNKILGLVTGVVHITEEGCINSDTRSDVNNVLSRILLMLSTNVNIQTKQELNLPSNVALAYNVNALNISLRDGSVQMSTVVESRGGFN